MKNALIFLLLLASLTFVPRAASSDPVFLDHSWWSPLTTSEKIIALQALQSGYLQGYFVASGRTPPTFSQPIGRYVDAIDAFYRQYPRLDTLDIADILGCMEDKPYRSCDDMARDLISHMPK